MLRLSITLDLLGLFCQPLWAQTIDAGNLDSKQIGRFSEYYLDADSSLDLEEANNVQWTPSDKDVLNFGFGSQTVWIRFKLNNSQPTDLTTLLEIGYPLLDYVTLYTPDESGSYEATTLGDRNSFKDRPYAFRNVVFPVPLKAGVSAQYYLKIKSTSSLSIPLTIYTPAAFDGYRQNDSAFLWAIFGIMFIMFCYNFFIFLSVRDKSYFIYSVFILSMIVLHMTQNGSGFQYLYPNLPEFANFLINPSLLFTIATGTMFTRYYLDTAKHTPRYDKAILLLVGIGCFGFVFSMVTSFAWMILVVAAFSIVSYIFSLGTGTWYVFRGSRQAIFYVTAWVFFIAGAATFSLRAFGIVETNLLTVWSIQLSSVLEVALLSFGFADKLRVMQSSLEISNKELQSLNENLEQIVADRTEELAETLEEVQGLKKQQDGDYYLTSLLLHPLQANNNDSEVFRTGFAVEQYKKFHFRKWDSEIGGDLCLTDRVIIDGKPYVFFINADAMGKSMQGAGGILVIGTALKSRLVQQSLGKSTDKFPETWLKSVYLDLQEVFLTFEGAMLISIVMGLVDESTGLMYYLNAEHPWTVLYRNKKASFIEETLQLRKLGTPKAEENFFVSCFQLEPNDKIILGSDGRDDILLGDNDLDVNEDETLFLKWVEEAGGRVDDILTRIKNNARLKDDISLLEIEYAHEEREPRNETLIKEKYEDVLDAYKAQEYHKAEELGVKLYHRSPGYAPLWRLMGSICFNLQKFADARDYLLKFHEHEPADSQILYILSRALFRLGDFKTAADYGEALYIREPHSLGNAKNLREIHEKLGNENRRDFFTRKISQAKHVAAIAR